MTRGWVVVAALGLAAACNPDTQPAVPPPPPLPPTPFVVSSPVTPAAGSPGAALLQSSPVVYVSLPRDSIPTGVTATIQDSRSGATVTTDVVEGGFDPVQIQASAGDTIAVVVQLSAGAPLSYVLLVPIIRPPIVVRTYPPPHKRDVPLNASLLVVFSEPIAPGSLTPGAVQLMHGGVVVAGQLSFTDGAHLSAVFVPAEALAPESDYELIVSQGVQDGKGVPLEAPVSVPFTTIASGVTMTLSPAALNIPLGGSRQTTVNLERNNFADPVVLQLLNAPVGVTGTFNPAQTDGNSAVLTVALDASVSDGIYNLVVQATADPNGPNQRTFNVPLILTVLDHFTLTTTPAGSVSVAQGNSSFVSVNIVPPPSGFTGSVALTVTGALPAGMTVALAPLGSILTITASGTTPVGAYPIVIHGNVAGLPEQLANLTIHVVAPSGAGNVAVSWASCAFAIDKPVWVAFTDGTSGSWTQVAGTGDVYRFSVTQSKGSVAYVILQDGVSTIVVQNMTQAELTAGTLNFCGSIGSPAGKLVNGTVRNLIAGFFPTRIQFAGAATQASADGPFQIQNANPGSSDLFGYTRSATAGSNDRVFVKRGENPANGGSFSVPVDFADPVLSAPAVAGSGTLNGLTGTETELTHTMAYFTGGAACLYLPEGLYSFAPTAAHFTFAGIPASLQVAGDVHEINFYVTDPIGYRSLVELFVDVPTRALTPFVLAPQLPAPVVTDAGGPYKRPTVVVTGVPAEYNSSHALFFQDQSTSGRNGQISATQGWVGGSTLSLALPNFVGVGSFDPAWAPATGDQVQWTISSTGGDFTNRCGVGQRFVEADRSGTM